MNLLKRILIWFDQGINLVVRLQDGWGSPDETLCARAYRLRKAHPKLYVWLDMVFFWEKNHCQHSYEIELQRKHLPKEYQNNVRN